MAGARGVSSPEGCRVIQHSVIYICKQKDGDERAEYLSLQGGNLGICCSGQR